MSDKLTKPSKLSVPRSGVTMLRLDEHTEYRTATLNGELYLFINHPDLPKPVVMHSEVIAAFNGWMARQAKDKPPLLN